MDASPTERFERVRESLLHLGLRQITEEPGPDQAANFARRRARFKQNRQDLDNFRAKQSASRAAAEARIDSDLRVRLEGRNSTPTLQFLFLVLDAESHRMWHRPSLAASGRHS
jgi:hypothetical protein